MPVSSPSSQLSSSPTVYQPSTPIFSSNNEIENLDNFSLTSEKSSSAPAASYAAALKSGSHTSMPETGAPAVVQSHPHQSVQSAIPFDQSPSQSSSSPYLHGLLSEPVNVTGYHLRSHASSLSEMDLNNSIFSFGSYDHAFHHHQQQFDHYSYTPNSPITPPMPLRHRAVTESYLLEQSPQSQGKQSYLHQSMYQRNQTASFASTMMNSQVPEYRQEYLRQEELTAHCNSRSPSIHSMHADSHSTSPLQQFNQAVNTPIWEGFENHRTNIERSVSLGWAPSSITSPSRRGMSDVGLTDISITLHSNSTINPSIPMQQPAPSEEAWSSLVDLNVGMQLPPRNSNIDPNDLSVRLDYDYSMSFHQDHRYSDASNLHVSGRSSSHMTGSPSRNTSLTMTNENHPIAEGIQELRLQAKEFVPQSQQQSQQQQQWSGSNSTPLPSSSSTSS